VRARAGARARRAPHDGNLLDALPASRILPLHVRDGEHLAEGALGGGGILRGA
jgi:hypothetical protein